MVFYEQKTTVKERTVAWEYAPDNSPCMLQALFNK